MPGNSKHATVSKNGCKILVIGHSHVKRIRRIDFNKDIRNEKSYICSFNGAVIKQLDHCIIPSLVYEKPEAFIIHGGTNNILYNAIKIDSNCRCHGLYFVNINLKKLGLNAFLRRINNILGDLCVINGFGFICRDMITTKYR